MPQEELASAVATEAEETSDDINPLDSSFYNIPVDNSPAEDDWEFLESYPDEYDDDINWLDIPVDSSPAEDDWEHALK